MVFLMLPWLTSFIHKKFNGRTDISNIFLPFCLSDSYFPCSSSFFVFFRFFLFFQASLNITFSMIFLFIVAQKRVFSLNTQLTCLKALNYQCLRYDLLRNKDKIISLILFHKIYWASAICQVACKLLRHIEQ